MKLHVFKSGQTYALQIINKERTHVKSYFVQFTTKEPFLYPRVEPRFNNGSWIAGWLVFYFGVIVRKNRRKSNE